ncbi:hypothetical protein Tco_1204857 [Tanacetum coccineum]
MMTEDNTRNPTRFKPNREPDNSLSMGDKHLDTIPETESDEVIKSSVEDLVPIPSESEGIPDKMCDVHLCENTTPLNTLNEHSEIVVNSDDDNSSSDDDSSYGEDIDYVDASPPYVDIVILEVDFPDCEDSRACSIHMSFTSSASFWESSIQI